MLRTLFAIVALATVAGCASSGPPQPLYGDAFAGLYNQTSASVPSDTAVTVQQPVAIIFSDNFEKWFAYVKATGEYWDSVIPSSLKNNVAAADADPNFLGGRVLEMLKRRFPQSEYVKDFQQAVASRKKSAIVADVLAHPMEPWKDRTTRFDITLYFFDANMNPVSRITGHGETNIPYGRATSGFQESIDKALAQLETKMNQVVR
jgi:hypothetical protein